MIKLEKLDKVVELIEEGTNLEIIKEMKTVLNKVFGDDFNQIVKPSVQSIENHFTSCGEAGKSLLKNLLDKNEGANLKVQIEQHIGKATHYNIIIYFPEIVITNGRNKHTIKELYVSISIRPNGTMVKDLRGLRAFLTVAEAQVGYVHSHLNVMYPSNMFFSSFCTGEGPINQVMMLLERKFSIPNFMLFCLHLKNFVVWESREGRPYLYMENIGKSEDEESPTSILSDSVMREAATQLYKDLKRTRLDAAFIFHMLTFNIDNLSIQVKATRAFEDWAASRIKEWNIRSTLGINTDVTGLLNNVDNAGVYTRIIANPSSRRTQYDPARVLLQFKNKDITFKLDKNVKEESPIINQAVPEKRITMYFCQKLSVSLTNAAFRNVRVKTGCAGGYKS